MIYELHPPIRCAGAVRFFAESIPLDLGLCLRIPRVFSPTTKYIEKKEGTKRWRSKKGGISALEIKFLLLSC